MIADQKLIVLLNNLEEYFGYEIKKRIMPPDHQALARCSISFIEEKWVLLYIPNTKVTQSMLCHELMHLVLFIEGFPVFCIVGIWEYTDTRNQILHMLCNLILHINVWNLTKHYGFDESYDYEGDIISLLIPQIKNGTLSLFRDTNIEVVFVGRACYIAQALLCPINSDLKNQIAVFSELYMKNEYQMAIAICKVFDRYNSLSPNDCIAILNEIFNIINVPHEIVKIIFPEKTIPDFRKRLFVSTNQN
jgi:hypothetical protein